MVPMKDPSQNLGECICNVQQGGNMMQNNLPMFNPFLDGKPVNIEVMDSRCRFPSIANIYSCLIVLIDDGWLGLLVAKLF